MKNIYLVVLSFLFSLLLVYLLLFSWVSIQKKYISKHNFSSNQILNFHKYYSNKLHHLRGKHFKINTERKEDYIFTEISKFSKIFEFSKNKNFEFQTFKFFPKKL